MQNQSQSQSKESPRPRPEEFTPEAVKKEQDAGTSTPQKAPKEPATPIHNLRPRRPKDHSFQCVCCACTNASAPSTPAQTPRKRKCATPSSVKRKSPAPKRRRVKEEEADEGNGTDLEPIEDSKLELGRKIEELKAAATEAAREKTRAEEAAAEAQELRGELSKQGEMIRALSEKLTSAQTDAAAQEGRQKELEEANTKMLEELAALRELMLKKDRELEALDYRRRKAVNDLEEVSCRIRVVCRARPCPEGEEEQQLAFPCQNNIAWAGALGAHKYDSVLGPDARQEDVFRVLQPYIEALADGHSCCVMAYGQTGSGKTHTIVGDLNDANGRGLIARALEALFALAERRRLVGWDYGVRASVLEVYNEVIYDLLDFEKRPAIKHDAENRPILFDATTVGIAGPADVSQLLRRVEKNRVVARTSFNMASSRSHVLFRFYVSGTKGGAAVLSSCLDVVDLSGSERFDSEAERARIAETVKINKSLSTLMHVVGQLALRKPHVPYRDSTLTHLLQASLSGRSKVVLIATVSGAKRNKEETLSTLRFADVACSCALNLPPQVPRASSSSRPQTPAKPRPQGAGTLDKRRTLTPRTPVGGRQVNRGSESARKQVLKKKN